MNYFLTLVYAFILFRFLSSREKVWRNDLTRILQRLRENSQQDRSKKTPEKLGQTHPSRENVLKWKRKEISVHSSISASCIAKVLYGFESPVCYLGWLSNLIVDCHFSETHETRNTSADIVGIPGDHVDFDDSSYDYEVVVGVPSAELRRIFASLRNSGPGGGNNIELKHTIICQILYCRVGTLVCSSFWTYLQNWTTRKSLYYYWFCVHWTRPGSLNPIPHARGKEPVPTALAPHLRHMFDRKFFFEFVFQKIHSKLISENFH